MGDHHYGTHHPHTCPQLIQSHLETVKLASVDCSICMEGVHDESVITDCDHYFHGPCLAAYAHTHRSTPVQVDLSSNDSAVLCADGVVLVT